MAKESDIRTKITKAIKEKGGRVIKYYGCIYTEAGVSDIMLCTIEGDFGAIETKRPGEKPTKKQAEFLIDIARREGLSGTASSPEDAMNILGKKDNGLWRIYDHLSKQWLTPEDFRLTAK